MPAAPVIARPAQDEFLEYYARYIDVVPGDNALPALRNQIGDTVQLLRPIEEPKALHRYAPDKWSVKEVVGHLGDTERIMMYRALRIGRGDTTPLPGFDEKAYVPEGRFDKRSLAELIRELETARAASIALFEGFDDKALLRRGTANEASVSARAIAWIIAGHELHHRAILIERYGIPMTYSQAPATPL